MSIDIFFIFKPFLDLFEKLFQDCQVYHYQWIPIIYLTPNFH